MMTGKMCDMLRWGFPHHMMRSNISARNESGLTYVNITWQTTLRIHPPPPSPMNNRTHSRTYNPPYINKSISYQFDFEQFWNNKPNPAPCLSFYSIFPHIITRSVFIASGIKAFVAEHIQGDWLPNKMV